MSCSQAPRTRLIKWQFSRNSSEEIPDVLSGLGGRFEKEEPGFAGVGFGVGGSDSALIGVFGDKIGFVACEGDDDVLVCLALELFYPGFCFIKGGLWRAELALLDMKQGVG